MIARLIVWIWLAAAVWFLVTVLVDAGSSVIVNGG